MLQQNADRSVDGGSEFGDTIYTWRGRISREKIRLYLPGWSKDTLYRIEKGESAPPFELLPSLFRAFWLAGVIIPLDGVQVFLKYARQKSESKKTRHERHSDEEWSELSDDLARIDHEFRSRNRSSFLTSLNPLLLDTSHLIRRDDWHEQVKRQLDGPERKKVLIIAGPSGIGKSSELSRLAVQLRRANTHRPILCDFRSAERVPGPEESLDVFLGSMLSALGYAQSQTPAASLEEQVTRLLEQVEKSSLPVIMLVDHAECILRNGRLVTCWERFLAKLLKYHHQTTLILVTRQWPTWFAGDLRFLAEVPVPPLPKEQGVLLLQQLGLKNVPVPLLQELSERVGGIPLCLEWVTALAKQSVFADDGEDGMQDEQLSAGATPMSDMTRSVRRLLLEQHIFGGSLAEEIAPLLDQLLSNYHLSGDARVLLQGISLTTVPLAKPALDVLCPQWMRVVKELHRASLLMAYVDRIQTFPSVAAAVVQSLSEEECSRQEETLIEAYQAWVAEGRFYENEKGAVIAGLVTLQLTHGHLLPAAETLIRYGWLAFHMGHTIRLARLARAAVEKWESDSEEQCQDQADECGKWLLHYFLSPYLGEKINADARSANYQRLLIRIIHGSVMVRPHTELFIVRHLAVHAMNRERYSDAQSLVVDCEHRLAAFIATDPDLRASVLEKWGFLYTSWCEHEEKQGNLESAKTIRKQAIAVYRQSQNLLIEAERQATPLKVALLKKRLARTETNLGFHLSRMGNYEEAIPILQQSIDLKEQGYTEPGSLSASYGDLSQALLGAGLLSEAQHYDVLAWDTIQRLAHAGDTLSQENMWNYYVNRGRLYVKLGRLDEAERLLREALDNLDERWEMYRMPAWQALEEIAHQRAGGTATASRTTLSNSSD